jgi:hypothetical protein
VSILHLLQIIHSINRKNEKENYLLNPRNHSGGGDLGRFQQRKSYTNGSGSGNGNDFIG